VDLAAKGPEERTVSAVRIATDARQRVRVLKAHRKRTKTINKLSLSR
jgi:hypothetical protein